MSPGVKWVSDHLCGWSGLGQRQGWEICGVRFGKGRNKPAVFTGDIFEHQPNMNPKGATDKLLKIYQGRRAIYKVMTSHKH